MAPDDGPAEPVLAHNPKNRTNADLIRDATRLGYIDMDQPVLDATYGRGGFWTHGFPRRFYAVDLDADLVADAVFGPGIAAITADFRDLPFETGFMGTVAFDPPYKLNGTSTGEGASAADANYGVASPDWTSLPWQKRHELIRAGITETTRVLAAGGHLLVKCQDQVCSGQKRWQTREFSDHAESLGHRLVDRLDLWSYRRQPTGPRQVHARSTFSTLLIFRLENKQKEDR